MERSESVEKVGLVKKVSWVRGWGQVICVVGVVGLLAACGGDSNGGEAPTAMPGETPGAGDGSEPGGTPDGTPGTGDGAGPGETPDGGNGLNAAAALAGSYAHGLRVEAGLPASLDAGAQVGLTFAVEGMVDVRQFEAVVELEPAGAFDPASAIFEPASPFITFGPGAEVRSENTLRIGGASLGSGQSGTAVLGTMKLNATAAIGAAESVVLRLTLFSIGPSSSLRDTYATGELQMEVRIK